MPKKRLYKHSKRPRLVKTGVTGKSPSGKQIRASGHGYTAKIGRNTYNVSNIVWDGSKVRSVTTAQNTLLHTRKYSIEIPSNSHIYFDEDKKITLIESNGNIQISINQKTSIEVDDDFICANL